MKPPVCVICRNRFDPGGASPAGGGGLVHFADYRPLPDGMTGHPAGTAWFCRRHLRSAEALRDRSLPEVLELLRRRRVFGVLLRLGLVFLVLLAGVAAWNVIGRVALGDLEAGYVGRVVEGRLRGMQIEPAGARLVARWIETRTRPALNPLRIVWQQLWYNAWTEGYDLVLWIEPASGDLELRWFALYQSGRTVFLRTEFQGRNRVLDSSFTVEELEREIEPHLRAVGSGGGAQSPEAEPGATFPE